MFQARDFIATDDGLIFAVVLDGLEDGRIVACLRYRQGESGPVKLASAAALALLRQRFPHYLHHSPHRDVTLQAVPPARVQRHWRPRPRLQTLCRGRTDDRLVQRLQRLVALLADRGVDPARLGVTGSLLLGCHRPDSDLDLVCYGHDTFQRARAAVRDLTAAGALQPLSEALWRTTWERRGCTLDFDTWSWHERRKFNKGAIDGTKFDLILAAGGPLPEAGGPWRKAGPVTLRATVTDDRHAFATPARYRLDHPDIPEALCFTATYLGQARTGERVEIRGRLEVSATGARRVVVGASREAPGEYIQVIEVNHARTSTPTLSAVSDPVA